MSAALGLYRLQQVDSRIDQIQARQKWIHDTLHNDASLQAATQASANAGSKQREAANLLKQAEGEVDKQRAKIEQTEASLYGGSVRNPKELQDLQKDIVSLKKYLETLEERQLEAMVNAETADQALHGAQQALASTQASVNEQNRDLALENETLLKELESLQNERKAVISDIAASMIEIYEQLRKQRRGLAVTLVSESACEACGTTLTLSQEQNARSNSQLFNCPSCGRILYAN